MVTTQLQDTLAAEEQKLLACIHCGLCLEACPTYVVTGDENDGPRGRLYLMRAVGEGRLSNQSASFKNHIDRCLGCRACEQVCPAGVQYGQLLEAARAEIVSAQPPGGLTGALLKLALRHVWPKPARLRLFFATSRMMRDLGVARLLIRSRFARLFSNRFEFAFALLDSSRPGTESKSFTTNQTADARGAVLLFSGCVGEGLFAHVNRATERVLRANGFDLRTPEKQVCCGALHAHAGDLDGARQLARQNIGAFASEKNIPIITNAGGCGAMLISYSHLLADDNQFAETAAHFSNRVKDVSQQLDNAEIEPSAAATTMDLVTYDASCHLLYGQRAADSSLRMLRSIDDLNFVELKGAERCCGAAGIYNLLQPELSGRVLREKLSAIAETGATVLTTGNGGCQMQIGAGACLSGMKLNTRHPVELLDESYARAGLYSERTSGMSLNRITLAVFAPILILAGIAGFLVPPEQSLMSGAPAYNVFHLIFGAIGLLVLFSKNERVTAGFNFGFGLIDLYQALASFISLPPEQSFRWTRVDDMLHVIIGLALVLIGSYGIVNESNVQKVSTQSSLEQLKPR